MTDDKLETIISGLLRTGVLLSVTVVAIGGAAYLAHHYSDITAYSSFRGGSSQLRTIGGILHGVANLRSDAIIQLGLLLLIATPIARVALAAVGFYLERDRLYVVISLIVLAILTYGILHAA